MIKKKNKNKKIIKNIRVEERHEENTELAQCNPRATIAGGTPPGADHENNQVGQWKITQATMYPGGFTSSPLADPYYWLFLNFPPWLLKNSKLHS